MLHLARKSHMPQQLLKSFVVAISKSIMHWILSNHQSPGELHHDVTKIIITQCWESAIPKAI